MGKIVYIFITIIAGILFFQCNNNKSPKKKMKDSLSIIEKKVQEFVPVELKTDISSLTSNEKKMLLILMDVAKIMDDLFWLQTYGDKHTLLDTIQDKSFKQFVEINYGPWERLNGNISFIPGIGEKPLGVNFYPKDMTKGEFEELKNDAKNDHYTILVRDENNKLNVVRYSDFYREPLNKASELLKQASELADDAGLKRYFMLRSKALLTNDYYESDLAWMDMKTNRLDMVVGPIEVYEDELLGLKAAFEAHVLIKDMEWSKKLEKYSAFLPKLQEDLPVASKYKSEKPGSSSDLGAYEVVYYAGDANAGSKSIAINLPNDEKVQALKGSRRLQLKNTMKAKFDNILLPISKLVINADQQKFVKFDAFFQNVMFHEVAHGLGIKNTLNGKGTVQDALKENNSAIEEAKADIMGLYLVTKLMEAGEFTKEDLDANYITYVAGIFRSVRFGVASSHGKANMLIFDHFKKENAFSKQTDGSYKIDIDKMKTSIMSFTKKILELQGDGNYAMASGWIKEKANIPAELKISLDKIAEAGIPRDIVLIQGKEVLGL